MDGFIGEIRAFAFNFYPESWLYCVGQELPVSQYQALYAVIGNRWGGTPNKTFKLPDLRGLAITGPGTSPEGAAFQYGVPQGVASEKISVSQMPPHTHVIQGQAGAVRQNGPTPTATFINPLYQNSTATPPFNASYPCYDKTPTAAVPMSPSAITTAGLGAAIDNTQPNLSISFYICTAGDFPVRS